jgi:hypothetical protein
MNIKELEKLAAKEALSAKDKPDMARRRQPVSTA